MLDFEIEQKKEADAILSIAIKWITLPLVPGFWFCDLIYAPDYKWNFLLIRLIIIPISLIVLWLQKRTKTLNQTLILSAIVTSTISSQINLLIYILNEPSTLYYHGLTLTSIAALAFVPFSLAYFLIVVALIFGPYYIITLSLLGQTTNLRLLAVQSFFIFSTIACCFLIRKFQNRLRLSERESRRLLDAELNMREKIIQIKTGEGLRLKNMARQFSPQVIQSLEEGGIDLEKEPSRTEICAIFIDICNSTSKVNQIKPTDFEASLGMFLDSVMQTFLKYDLTIDKFLGDGIMAFCNSPLPRKDFVIRTCLAALETKIILEKKQSELLPFWRSPLDIRIGIAVGECNVGFYGNKKYFKTFTAIGPVINKAARLCSIAHPNEIILDERTKQFLPVDFLVNELGHKDLKGFEKEQNQTYSLISHPLFNKKELRNPECPSCNQIMNLEFTDDGQCLLVCRNCCTTHAPFLSET